MSILQDQVDRAQRMHYALALMAAGLGGTGDPSELRRKVESAMSDALAAPAPAVCFVDGEERIVWVILPGLLPKRAAEASRHLRNLLDQERLPVARLAVLGYPRDASNAKDLVVRCREQIDAHREEAAAHDFAEAGRQSSAGHPTAP